MAPQYPPPQPHFDNILNFRDVGLTVNSLSSGQTPLKAHVMYRSARPDEASSRDRQLLVETYRIKTIIDLRSKTELLDAAKKHSDAALASPAHSSSEIGAAVVSNTLQIPHVIYAHVNLNGKTFERALLWKLSWSNLGKLVALMTLGYRKEAISIIGREVMQPRGLIGLGVDTLDHSGDEIREVFEILSDKQVYPVMIHCTQGKDRTGLIVLLLLCLCRIQPQVITEDYLQSEVDLLPEMKQRMKEIESIGLDQSFAGCPPKFVPSILDHIEQRYGGIESYLVGIGVTQEMQKRTLDALKQEGAGPT